MRGLGSRRRRTVIPARILEVRRNAVGANGSQVVSAADWSISSNSDGRLQRRAGWRMAQKVDERLLRLDEGLVEAVHLELERLAAFLLFLSAFHDRGKDPRGFFVSLLKLCDMSLKTSDLLLHRLDVVLHHVAEMRNAVLQEVEAGIADFVSVVVVHTHALNLGSQRIQGFVEDRVERRTISRKASGSAPSSASEIGDGFRVAHLDVRVRLHH